MTNTRVINGRPLWCAKVTFLLLLCLRFCPIAAQQSIPVPDEVIPDVEGRTWRIYDLLDSGKTVVLVFFTSSCQSCWAYYKENTLQQYAARYGPKGVNKAQVIFIESDPTTNIDCLYGRSRCNGFTMGNWVEDANFPVANYERLADLMKINQFPTVVVACPNRRGVKIEQSVGLGVAQLWERTDACPVAYGQNNLGIFNVNTGTEVREVCGPTKLQPGFLLINLGKNEVNTAKMELWWNGRKMQEQGWTGSLPLYGEARIQFDSFRIEEAGKMSIMVGMGINTNDDDVSDNQVDVNMTKAAQFGRRVLLRIQTDEYGSDLYWEVRNASGRVVDYGGNRSVGAQGGGRYPNGAPVSVGAYGPRMQIVDTLLLPAAGCYSIHFVDAFGDGICCNQGTGSYQLVDVDRPNEPLLSGGEFKAYDVRTFHLRTISTTTNLQTLDAAAISLQPTLVTDQFTVQGTLPAQLPVQLTVMDATGRLLTRQWAQSGRNADLQHTFLDVNWPAGVYFLHIQAGQYTTVRSFVVQ